MAKLVYDLIPTQASWEQHLYHTAVMVKEGVVEVNDDDALTIEALQYIGFKLIEETAEEATVARSSAKKK